MASSPKASKKKKAAAKSADVAIFEEAASLEGALALVLAGKDAEALDVLLDVWRENAAAEIADLMDLVGERFEKARPPVTPGKMVADRVAAWVTLESAGRPEDVRQLLDTLLDVPRARDVGPRLGLLAKREPDPRIAMGITRILETRYQRGSATWKMWRQFCGLVMQHLDLRTLAVLAKIDEAHRGSKTFTNAPINRLNLFAKTAYEVKNRLDEHALVRPLSPAETEVIGKIRACFAGDRASAASDAKTSEDFFRRIHADPDDDGLRQVFADWLLERNDPRGEFINLQLQRLQSGKATQAAARRERELLNQHEREWLGAIEPVILKDGRSFERGFLESCRVRSKSDRVGKQVIGRPEWSTVREIDVGAWQGNWQALVMNPSMRSVKAVRGVSLSILQTSAEHAFEILGFAGAGRWETQFGAAAEAFRNAGPHFPKLKSIEFESVILTPQQFRPFWKTDLGMRLESFSLMVWGNRRTPADLDSWLEEAGSAFPPALKQFSLRATAEDGWRLRLERGEEGTFDTLRAKFDYPRTWMSPLSGTGPSPIALLRAMLMRVPETITHFEVASTKVVGTEADIAAFRTAVGMRFKEAVFEVDVPDPAAVAAASAAAKGKKKAGKA